MATRKPATKIAEVLIEEEQDAVEEAVPATAPEPTIVAPTTKNAKVKGTWRMYYGAQSWDFVDGRRYDLPLDLYEYLRANGNIYDTL